MGVNEQLAMLFGILHCLHPVNDIPYMSVMVELNP